MTLVSQIPSTNAAGLHERVVRSSSSHRIFLEKSTKRLLHNFENLPNFVKGSKESDIRDLSSVKGMRDWIQIQMEFANVDLSALTAKERQIVNTKLAWLLYFYIENRRGAEFLKKIERDDREMHGRFASNSRRMFASKGLAALQEDLIRNPTGDVEFIVRGPNKEILYVTEVGLGSSTFIDRAKAGTEMITFADIGVLEIHPLD